MKTAKLTLATWNVNSLSVRLTQVLDWLTQFKLVSNIDVDVYPTEVDVLALQEIKITDDKFPHAAFAAIGYQSFCFGQKTYNGVALLVKNGIEVKDVVVNLPNFDDDSARVITATVGGVRVACAYFPNGQTPGSEKFDYKMHWLQALRYTIKDELLHHSKLVLMGDYNITFDDADVWNPQALHEEIHCTEEERYHLRALLALDLHDALRLFVQPSKSYTWWDYRHFAFQRNHGLRIDHILISDALKEQVISCCIDKTPRKNERPSDHVPVVVSMVLN